MQEVAQATAANDDGPSCWLDPVVVVIEAEPLAVHKQDLGWRSEPKTASYKFYQAIIIPK